ncbi:30S ribosomal protein S20 [Euzebya sp.]|uniref:30S ribosomal protein S20 n=1 Tax=Euzebya sp. TaxID=1971409 RepID=UPI003518009D
MANIKSQIKRNRQNEAARQRNKAKRTSLKTAIKRFEATVESGDAAAAGEAYREVARRLDKAASAGVIHQNKAANKKSRLAARIPSA